MDSGERFFAIVANENVDKPASWMGLPVTGAIPGLLKYFVWYLLGPMVGFRWSTDKGISRDETPHTAGNPLFDDPAISEYDLEEGREGPFVKLGALLLGKLHVR